ncbi:type I restriction-modification system subunit M [Jannaschia sp. W003]|uniref:class I SAM-dependent DNA methyltransferase n=1 Tax=Jannaschia sp. W003 TaxID=2867012 RepID=UPI0021A47607|nr:type I restriction-modification system subunit M [Jannaschia sp. W003]UWQ20123.1 type I restriction-modification system subunit M [Jannaschia sp. W003]
MSATQNIVAKLWKLCDVLRDDGVTYSEYVTELTYLLFLKMMEETGQEHRLPPEYRWADLANREGLEQLTHYKQLLTSLGNPLEKDQHGEPKPPKDPLVLAIFTDAQTRLRKPANLKSLTTSIDGLDWFDAREEGLGDLYEGLLQKNAEDKKSGAGQYFTPRPLIDCIVRLAKPQLGERIQDPAAGTGGFVVAAHRKIFEENNEFFGLDDGVATRQIRDCYTLAELVPDTHRLCLMNLMLHGIEGDAKSLDTMTGEGASLPKADLVLSNPPFGTKKGGGRPQREDFSTTAGTSNKQLAFVEHIIRALKRGGRAAVVVPDNVLFEDGTGKALRRMLMDWCDLHTILRLPTGIFYAQGVKTNIIFFTRRADGEQKGGTEATWVYDMRAGAPSYGKTRPLRAEDFAAFEAAFGDDPRGQAERQDEGEEGRFRRFTREDIAARGDSLDISWLRDGEEEAEDGLIDPDDITAAILGHLREATREIEALVEELEGGEEDEAPVAVAAE